MAVFEDRPREPGSRKARRDRRGNEDTANSGRTVRWAKNMPGRDRAIMTIEELVERMEELEKRITELERREKRTRADYDKSNPYAPEEYDEE